MKQWFALSAIGRDRPGIVADLAELIYECDCNLEDSSMTILGSEFAVLLLLSGAGEDLRERLSNACKRLEWEKRLTVFFRPLEGAPAADVRRDHAAYELRVTGLDKAGMVARVARCLAELGINITQMTTQSRPEPQTGRADLHHAHRHGRPRSVADECPARPPRGDRPRPLRRDRVGTRILTDTFRRRRGRALNA